MSRSFKLKTALVIFIVLACIVILVPTTGIKLPNWWQGSLPSKPVRLGLDLQGGVYLLLEVEVDKAVTSSVERAAQELYRRLTEDKVRLSEPTVDDKNAIHFSLLSDADKAAAEEVMKNSFGQYVMQTGAGNSYTLQLTSQEEREIREHANYQALETIRNRVDMFGVAEPEIIPQTDNRILIQLPGMSNTKRAIDLIGKTAQLEFKLVVDNVNPANLTPATVPPGTELLTLSSRDPETRRVETSPILVRSRASMTGDTITDARAQVNSSTNEWLVNLSFNATGSRQFADLTASNVNKRLAIVLDGNAYSAPVIKEAIGDGSAVISGDFTPDTARDLAVVLRSGALPAPVKVQEERTVGPSLGNDSIRQGITAALIGGILIILFMVVYYKISGIAADMAVVLNIIILMAIMVLMDATLTLPGIAGIILTIGMAVDANVLINERIREELRLGKTPAAAVETGYGRATITILDANITTILAAIVLYQFGTGPIKGFAVTLTIGLTCSMFTAIVVTRMLFDYVIRRYRPKTLSI